MTEEESDQTQDQLTQRLIGFLTGARELGDSEEAEDAFIETVGAFAKDLMPDFTVAGRMTQEELAERISEGMTAHMIRLLSAVAFLFGELADVNDSSLEMSTAEVLQTISANIRSQNGEAQ